MVDASNRVEIPEAPIWETFRAVFEQSVAALEAPAGRQSLLEAWEIVAAAPGFRSVDHSRAEEILTRGLDLLDDARILPEPGRHFLRVALLQTFAALRHCQRREAESLFIRIATAGYVQDHVRLDRHPLHGFLLFFQASRSDLGWPAAGEGDEAFDFEGAGAPFKVELPVC